MLHNAKVDCAECIVYILCFSTWGRNKFFKKYRIINKILNVKTNNKTTQIVLTEK